MTQELPAPLTPADCDLRSFGFMPLDVQRLLTSEWWINSLEEMPEACGPAVNLWATSWHQVPAASLPDSDAVMRKIAGVTRETWIRIRDRVLEPWIKCSDGRLYHPVVAEKALEAVTLKRKKSEGGREGNRRRWGSDTDRNPIARGSQTDQTPIGPDRYPTDSDRKDKTDKTDKTDSSSAREGFKVEKDPALIVIQAFDQALVDTWGPERRRPFPVGSDIVYARRWFAAGYKPEDLYRLFLARQQARKAKDRDPIGSLAFLENAVTELGGASTAPAAAGQAQVRFLSPEAELRARRDWFNRDLAAHKATGSPMGEVQSYGMAWDRDANQFRLAAGDRPPIPPAAPREAAG